jgi:pilus assembly protein CpaB
MGALSKTLAVILVIAAILLGAYAWLLSRRPVPVQRPTTQMMQPARNSAQYPVVVAARALEAGQPIRADALSVVSLANRPAGSFGQVQGLVGQVPLARIESGAPVTSGSLASSVALQLQPGERAMAVPVDELSAVGHRVQPGDHVDVFMTLESEQNRLATGSEPTPAESRLVASNLRVLGYGSDTLGDAARQAQAEQEAAARRARDGKDDDDDGSDNRSGRERRVPTTAVLAVPIGQVNALTLATRSGKLVLALRNPRDATVADTSLFPQPAPVLASRPDLDKAQKAALEDPANRAFAGLDLPNLAGTSDNLKAGKPVVKKARVAQPGRTLEVIRGDKRSRVSY